MSYFPPDALDVLDAFHEAAAEDAVTFQAPTGGRRSGNGWGDVAGLEGLPALVVAPSPGTEPLVAGRFAGRLPYTVDVALTEDVNLGTVGEDMRLVVAARGHNPARVLAVAGPPVDVASEGRWLRVVAVDEGADPEGSP